MSTKRVTASSLLLILLLAAFADASSSVIQKDGLDYTDSYYGKQNGASINNSANKIVDCTSTSISGCDSNRSVLLGSYNYDNGWNAVEFDFFIPERVECLDEDFRINMNIQLNGPTSTTYNRNKGWTSTVTENGKGWSNTPTDASFVLLQFYDYTNDTWDTANANRYYKFSNGNVGTLTNQSGSQNDGTSFRPEYVEIPYDGSIYRSGRVGSYFENSSNSSGIDISMKWVNVPKKLTWGTSENLRTEIEEVEIRYEDETLAPDNPSSSGSFSRVSGHQTFVKNHWTGTDNFRYNSTLQATDNCEVDYVEYILQTSSSPSPSQSASGTKIGKDVADNFDMSSFSDGAYKIWLRAVDSKGNKASWMAINDEVKLDRTNPTQTGFRMNTPTSGWYNGSISPELTYNGNFSDTNGISYYYITLSGDSGSLKNTTATSWTFDSQAQSKLATTCGTRNIKVTAFDNSLPVANSVTATRTINFDNCKPTTPQLQTTDWIKTSTQQITLSNSYEQPGQSGLAYCNVLIDGTTYNISASDCSQYFTLTLSLQDGTYPVTTTACDVAGNCNISNNVQTIKVDTTNPQLSSTPIFNSPSVNTWVKDTELSFSISADDPSVGNSVTSNVDEIYLRVQKTSEPAPTASRMANSQYSSICTSNSCNYNISMNLSDGEWKVWYYVTDKAGNSLGPSPTQDTVKIDTTSPSSVRPQWSSDVTSTSVDPFWPNSVDNGSGIDYYSLRFTDTNNNTVYSTTTNAISYSNSAVGNGTYHLCLKAVDNAGNPSAEDCTQHPVVVDKINPIFNITSSLSGWSRTNFVTFSWNSTDNYRMDYVRYSDSTTSSAKLDANYSRTLSNLAQGIHTYMFECADLAGNIIYQNISFGVDYTAPDVFFYSQYENYWNNVSTHFVEWNVSDQYSGLENVTIQVNSNTPLSGLGGIGNISFNFNSGIHSIKLTAFDKIGNNITETIVIKVDLATPSLSCSKNPNGWLSFLPNVYVNTATNGTISPLTLEASYRGSPISVVNGTVTLPTSLDGVHIFDAIYYTEAGNFETCTLEVLLDRRDPIQLSIVKLGSVISTNSTTVETDFYDEMSGIESISWTVDDVVVLQESSNIASRVINLTQFADGQKTIEVEVIDKAGNTLLWQVEFILDRTSPEISIFELMAVPQSNWYSDKSVLINIEGNDNLDQSPTFELFINGNSSIVQQGEQLVELRDGENNLVLRVTDHGGLISESTLIAYVDSVIPQCLIIPEFDGNYWYNQSTRNFSLISNSSSSNLSYYEISNGIERQIQASFSTNLSDGRQLVTVKVVSESGLYSSCEKLQLVDTTADFLEMTISNDFGNYGNGIVEVNISSQTGFDAPRELVIYANGEVIHHSNHSAAIDEHKSFFLESNSYDMMALITDEAGNVFSVEQRDVEVIIDRTPMNSECSIEDLILTSNPTDSIFEGDIFSQLNIICVLSDNNPINLDDEIGKLYSLTVNGDIPDEITKTEEGFTVRHFLTQSSFSNQHNISFTTSDMWNNENQHYYSFIPISSSRNIQLSQGDSMYELNWLMQDLMDEQNCLITWKIEGFDEYVKQELCTSSLDSTSIGSIEVVEMLNQIDHEFEQSQNIKVIGEVSTAYGETKRDTYRLTLKTCKNQNYEFRQSTYDCFQRNYDGFNFTGENYSINLGENLTIAHTGEQMPLNTTCSEYNGSFTQYIGMNADLMTLNLSSINPLEDSKIPLNNKFEIAIICEDGGGFSETFTVHLSVKYQPPTLIEKLVDLFQGNELYVLGFISTIVVVGVLLKIKITENGPKFKSGRGDFEIKEEE